MKIGNGGVGTEAYPYLVTRIGPRYAQRSELQLPIRERKLAPPGAECGRSAQERLLEVIKSKAAATGYHMCVVWAPHSCTFVTPTGELDYSDTPPDSSSLQLSGAVDFTPVHIEPCFSVPIPSTAEPNRYFVCAKRTGALVEIMLGEHMVLGDLPDKSVPVPPGFLDAGCLPTGEDPWLSIKRYRGQPVSSIVNDAILGPVQPVQGHAGITLHEPWKHEVAAACATIAGQELSPEAINEIWSEVGAVAPLLRMAA